MYNREIMFLEKDLFLRIHNEKSIKFEKEECKNEFEKINYKVWIDQVDRKNSSLQIDLIAFKKKKVFVCEVKIWDIKEYFEQSRTHELRKRDLKGIVDGLKYTKEKVRRTYLFGHG